MSFSCIVYDLDTDEIDSSELDYLHVRYGIVVYSRAQNTFEEVVDL